MNTHPLAKEEELIAARRLGITGAQASERDRQLFEAWMAGHCWAVHGQWNGTTYMANNEGVNYCCPYAMHTRQLWAVWRDRAALEGLLA